MNRSSRVILCMGGTPKSVCVRLFHACCVSAVLGSGITPWVRTHAQIGLKRPSIQRHSSHQNFSSNNSKVSMHHYLAFHRLMTYRSLEIGIVSFSCIASTESYGFPWLRHPFSRQNHDAPRETGQSRYPVVSQHVQATNDSHDSAKRVDQILRTTRRTLMRSS